jgi:non-heme chloroperoxidase
MTGCAEAYYDVIVAFSHTDFPEDLRRSILPVLVMRGDDDQIVPNATPRRCQRNC